MRTLRLDKDDLLSAYNLINARMCSGKLPPAIIVLSNEKTKRVDETVTRRGLTVSTLTHTQQKNADINFSLISTNGGAYILNPNEPVVITYYPHMAEESEETRWCTTWHEMCHALAADEAEDHGPRWTRYAKSGGMTVNTGKNDAGEDCQVGEGHRIIPGGDLDKVRREWQSGGMADAPQQSSSAQRQPAPTGGRFVAPRSPAPQTSTGRGRFSVRAPQTAVPGAPTVTKADIPQAAKRIFIYCDRSGSMYGGGDAAMATALNGLWPIKGAELFAYADRVEQINSPDDLCSNSLDVGGGTSFEAIMLHAEQYNPDMVLIFSDGVPNDEHRAWDVWNRTDFPISTHYCISGGCYSRGVDDDLNDGAFGEIAPHIMYDVEYMRSLCRGGGEATVGDDPIDIQEGVKKAMTNSRTPRQLPDLRPRINTGIARIKGKLGVGKRIVELGDEIEDAKFNAAVGQAINAIDGTFDNLAAELDGMFGQAFDGQREQSRVNATHWADAADKLHEGLGKLSTGILGAAKTEIEGTLVAGQQRVAATRARPDAVRVGGVSINPNLLARSAAVRAANANGARALPAPASGGAREQRALPPPAVTDAPVNVASETPAQRERAPSLARRVFSRGQ